MSRHCLHSLRCLHVLCTAAECAVSSDVATSLSTSFLPASTCADTSTSFSSAILWTMQLKGDVIHERMTTHCRWKGKGRSRKREDGVGWYRK